MEQKLKKLASYYKPYLPLFLADMFFAILGAGVTLAIPLIVRYITNHVITMEAGADRWAWRADAGACGARVLL